jgi:hypothetical protein
MATTANIVARPTNRATDSECDVCPPLDRVGEDQVGRCRSGVQAEMNLACTGHVEPAAGADEGRHQRGMRAGIDRVVHGSLAELGLDGPVAADRLFDVEHQVRRRRAPEGSWSWDLVTVVRLIRRRSRPLLPSYAQIGIRRRPS